MTTKDFFPLSHDRALDGLFLSRLANTLEFVQAATRGLVSNHRVVDGPKYESDNLEFYTNFDVSKLKNV